MLRTRLWEGFARLQVLLGGHAGPGRVIEREGLVASVVPAAPDSPTLNAAVAIDPDAGARHLAELRRSYEDAQIRRWGVWLDGGATEAAEQLTRAGLLVSASSPGMGAMLDHATSHPDDDPHTADLATVGRLERTLTPLPNGVLSAYRADHDGQPAAVALALHHNHDCGVSFVATIPQARRQGLATAVMRQALRDAIAKGCTTTTLQATDVGERLYENLGYRRLCAMQLWELRR